MVRKHGSWMRERDRIHRRRLKTPAPKQGWLLAELAELAGVPDSTVRYYVQERLLRPIERRGTATRYDRRELLRLLGYLRLKVEERSTLAAKKRKMEAMGDEQLEQWLRSGSLPPKAAQALGMDVTPNNNVTPGVVLKEPGIGIAVAQTAVEHWQRLTILPGLDLMLRADAKEAARIVAQRIIETYVG